jgi:hypothetical protein
MEIQVLQLMNNDVPKKTSIYIYYTGYGCKPSYHHTVNEFIDIMERHFTHEYLNHKGIIKQESQNGDNSYYIWLTDMYYNYNKWVDFAGASIIGEITLINQMETSNSN